MARYRATDFGLISLAQRRYAAGQPEAQPSVAIDQFQEPAVVIRSAHHETHDSHLAALEHLTAR
jgi:hypothetical protein